MVLAGAAAALAVALGAAYELELALGAEVRDTGGGTRDTSVSEPVPYEVQPAAGVRLELDRHLTLGASLSPRVLLVAPPGGGRSVHSTAAYGAAAAFASWRPGERISLVASGSAARGTLQLSPLSQISQARAPSAGSPPDQPPAPLDPSVGVRSAQYASASGRLSAEWRTSERLAVLLSASYSRSGGLGERGRTAFPLQEGPGGEAAARLSVSPLDTLTAAGSYARTEVAGQGATALLGLSGRWDRRILAGLTGMVGVGAVATLDYPRSAARDLPIAPQAEIGLTKSAPVARPGIGFSMALAYAPFLDPYARRVQQRLSGRATADWLTAQPLRLSGAMTGAATVGAGSGPVIGGAELGLWAVRAGLEVGLVGRAGLQESGQPLVRTWQWGVSLAARWTRRGAL